MKKLPFTLVLASKSSTFTKFYKIMECSVDIFSVRQFMGFLHFTKNLLK